VNCKSLGTDGPNPALLRYVLAFYGKTGEEQREEVFANSEKTNSKHTVQFRKWTPISNSNQLGLSRPS
jgi:hypothetical protein